MTCGRRVLNDEFASEDLCKAREYQAGPKRGPELHFLS